MTSTYPIGTFGSVASLLAAIICRYRMSYCKPFIHVYGVFYFGPQLELLVLLIGPIRVDNIMLFKTWCDRNSTQKNIFPYKQAINNNCAYCRNIYLYLYCFFPRKSLYSLWLHTKSYSVLSLTTSRWTLSTNQSINQQVFLWLCCTHLHLLSLQIQKSFPWLNIHILVYTS